MAIPTIDSITPNRGHSGGQGLVEIIGTGFQVQAAPGPGVPAPIVPPSMRVFFGGVEARRVDVISSTRLFALTDGHDLPKGADEVSVNVEARNVGPFGETIGSEVAIKSNGFKYARSSIDATADDDLSRVARMVIRKFKREVLEETVLVSSTDWDSDPGNLLNKTTISKLPSVFLVGPAIRKSTRNDAQNESKRVRESATQVIKMRAPRIVDMTFGVGCIAGNYKQMLALTAAIERCLHRDQKLIVPVADGSSEFVKYDMGIENGGDLQPNSDNDPSNVYTSIGSFTIYSIDILGASGFDRDMAMSAEPTVDENGEIVVNFGSDPL